MFHRERDALPIYWLNTRKNCRKRVKADCFPRRHYIRHAQRLRDLPSRHNAIVENKNSATSRRYYMYVFVVDRWLWDGIFHECLNKLCQLCQLCPLCHCMGCAINSQLCGMRNRTACCGTRLPVGKTTEAPRTLLLTGCALPCEFPPIPPFGGASKIGSVVSSAIVRTSYSNGSARHTQYDQFQVKTKMPT